MSNMGYWGSSVVSIMGYWGSSVVEHYGILGELSDRALWDTGRAPW